MEQRLARIENKLDEVHTQTLEIKLGYKEHERRSLANEAAVEMLTKQFKPIEELLVQVRLLIRVSVALAAAATLVYTLLEIKHLL